MAAPTIATSTPRYSRSCRWCQGEGRVVKPSRLTPGAGVPAPCGKCNGEGRIYG